MFSQTFMYCDFLQHFIYKNVYDTVSYISGGMCVVSIRVETVFLLIAMAAVLCVTAPAMAIPDSTGAFTTYRVSVDNEWAIDDGSAGYQSEDAIPLSIITRVHIGFGGNDVTGDGTDDGTDDGTSGDDPQGDVAVRSSYSGDGDDGDDGGAPPAPLFVSSAGSDSGGDGMNATATMTPVPFAESPSSAAPNAQEPDDVGAFVNVGIIPWALLVAVLIIIAVALDKKILR